MTNPRLSRSLLFIAATVVIIVTDRVPDIHLMARAASSIYGTVTDAETDDPVADADVYIYEEGNKDNDHRTTTDRNGDYSVTVDPGTYNISIGKRGYKKHNGQEDVGFEEQVEHNAELEPDEGGGGGDTYLEGIVTDSDTGDPITGADVVLTDDKNTFKGTTDRRGHYNISCKEGAYSIKVSHKDYETHEGSVQIESGGNTYDAQLTPGTGDGGDRKKDGSTTGDGDEDDDFKLLGTDGLMVLGWVIALVLGAYLIVQRRDQGDDVVMGSGDPHPSGPSSATDTGSRVRPLTRKSSPSKHHQPTRSPRPRDQRPDNQCPACGGKGEYSQEYNDYFCWECKDYFDDLK